MSNSLYIKKLSSNQDITLCNFCQYIHTGHDMHSPDTDLALGTSENLRVSVFVLVVQKNSVLF